MESKTCCPLEGDPDHVTQSKAAQSLSVMASLSPTREFLTLKVSKPLINCVKKNQNKLQEMLRHPSTISMDMESEQLEINPCLDCENLENWKATCQSVAESYLASLVSETVSISSELKTAAQSLIANCTDNHPQVDVKFDEENLSVVISGEKPMVDDLKGQLCKLQKVNQGSKISKALPYLRSKFHRFGFKAKTKKHGVSVIEKANNEDDYVFVEDYVMSCTTVNISNDIAQFLSTTKGKKLLESYLQNFESLFAVQFDHSGRPVLLCSSKDDGISAAKKIEDHVISVCVPFDLPTMLLPLFKGEKWIALCSELEETYSASIILSGGKLTVVGDKNLLVAVKEKIQKFLESNCYVEKSIPLCWAQWRLLTTHMNAKWVKVKQKLESESMIKHSVPNKMHEESSIVIMGGKPIVTHFAQEVERLVLSMCTSPPIEQTRPGTVKFFNSEKGTTLIKGIESEEKSCIQLCVLCNDNEKDGSSTGCCTKLCTGETKDGTIITLVEGDITEFPVDVIVNAANCNLHHIGGVALAIAEKGGPTIQEDSNWYIRREGKLSDGDAVIAKEVGKLPCKRLIHTVGPKWTGGQNYEEAILKKACMESLKLASDYKTVSFPAISSGVFGFPAKKWANCMMEAFLEYCASNTLSVISEITVVVCNKPVVSAFTEEMHKNLFNFQSSKQLSPSTSLEDTLEVNTERMEQTPPHVVHPEYTAHPRAKSKITDPDIITQFIQLHKGELLKQKV